MLRAVAYDRQVIAAYSDAGPRVQGLGLRLWMLRRSSGLRKGDKVVKQYSDKYSGKVLRPLTVHFWPPGKSPKVIEK